MDQSNIDNLREALKFSPENVPLRLHLAETLCAMSQFEEAEKEYLQVLKIKDSEKAKLGLAHVFFQQAEYAKCNVLLEEMMDRERPAIDVMILYAKALLRENKIGEAVQIYEKVNILAPHFKDEELDAKLKVSHLGQDHEEKDLDFLDEQFLEKPDLSFKDVGGLDHVKREIDLKIIQPLKHPEIYKAYGKKIGGGILLYGPPGCGKTFLAKATAGQVSAQFISMSLNDILDMYIGNSEKNLHEIFELARANAPCVLFIDEIDALGASRTDMKTSAGRHLINQFLQELDGIDASNEGILIIGATNAPWHLDPAIRRPGRFDRIIFVPPPDQEARTSIFKIKLAGKPIHDINYDALGSRTKEFSGADIEAVIDICIEDKLEKALLDGVPQPMKTKDLQNAIKKHKASTKEWFSTARNFALFANESGLYDDILKYLKIKK